MELFQANPTKPGWGNRPDDRNAGNNVSAEKIGEVIGGEGSIIPVKRKAKLHRTMSDPICSPSTTQSPTYSSPIIFNYGRKQLQLEPFKEECEEDLLKDGDGGEDSANNEDDGDDDVFQDEHHHSKTDDRIKPSTPSTFIAHFEDDEISTGLPSDLPSDLFDIEGNLLCDNLHNLRFDLEEEDFFSADEEEHQRRCRSKRQADLKSEAFSNARVNLTKANHPKKWVSVSMLKDKLSLSSTPQSRKNQGKGEFVGLGSTSASISSSSNKFALISTTCAIPSKPGENVGAGAGRGKAEINIDEGGNSKVSRRRSPRLPKKYISMEEPYLRFQPVLINNVPINTNSMKENLSSHYHFHEEKDQLSSTQSNSSSNGRLQSSGHSSNNNTSGNSSAGGGNFSPPSDHFRSPLAPFDRHHSSGGGSSSQNSSSTITQHYYPEGGWGYMILITSTICHVLTCGFQLSFSVLWNAIMDKFGSELQLISCMYGKRIFFALGVLFLVFSHNIKDANLINANLANSYCNSRSWRIIFLNVKAPSISLL